MKNGVKTSTIACSSVSNSTYTSKKKRINAIHYLLEYQYLMQRVNLQQKIPHWEWTPGSHQ